MWEKKRPKFFSVLALWFDFLLVKVVVVEVKVDTVVEVVVKKKLNLPCLLLTSSLFPDSTFL